MFFATKQSPTSFGDCFGRESIALAMTKRYLLNNIIRVDVRAANANFKVQMRAEGIARIAGVPDQRALPHGRTHADIDLA